MANAEETTKPSRNKFETVRFHRVQITARTKEADELSRCALVEHAAEHLASMRAAFCVMDGGWRHARPKVRKADLECEVAGQTRDNVQQEMDHAEDNFRIVESNAAATAAAKALHEESAARRAQAHAAEVRRAAEEVTKAVALRDCESRSELLDDVRATLARRARVAAASAEHRLSIALQQSDDSLPLCLYVCMCVSVRSCVCL